MQNETIYKGIKIIQTPNNYFVFEYNGITFKNTNLRFAKVIIGKIRKCESIGQKYC